MRRVKRVENGARSREREREIVRYTREKEREREWSNARRWLYTGWNGESRDGRGGGGRGGEEVLSELASAGRQRRGDVGATSLLDVNR